MFLQPSRLQAIELFDTAVEHGIGIPTGQAGNKMQPVDISMFTVDRLRKCTPCRVIPRTDHIGRRADPSASVAAKINQVQNLSLSPTDARPGP